MENRENRCFERIARRVRLALTGVACVVLLAFGLMSGAWAASGCDAVLVGTVPPLYQGTLPVRGKEPVRQSLRATTSEILVFAREHGVDVTLEVVDSGGRSVGSADNPVARAGIQRLMTRSKAAERYSIVLTGKDRADSNGTVDVVVIDLQHVTNSSCLTAQRVLSKADAAYAAGESITRATTGVSAVNSQASQTNAEKPYQEAAAGYRQAAADLQASGPSSLLAQSQLSEASILNLNLDSYVEAKDWATQAEQTFTALNDPYGDARARATESAASADIAVRLKGSGSVDANKQAGAILEHARLQMEEVVAFHASRRELYDQAWAQNYVGVIFYYEDRYAEAIRAYQKSLPLYEQLHESKGHAQVLQNVAVVEYELGRNSDAIPHFAQALSLIRSEGNPKLLAKALGNSAFANLQFGNADTALRELSESLALARTTQDAVQQSIDLHSMASAYATLGDETRALEFERQALALFTAIDYTRGRNTSLRSIANIRRGEGHADDALKMDQQALSLETTALGRNRTAVQIAKDLIALGRRTEAAEALQSVVDPSQNADEVLRARGLQERARLRAGDRNYTGAEADLKTALATYKANELQLDEITAWIAEAQLMRQRGMPRKALAAIEQALALAEEVRLYSANPELRSTLLQPLRPAFDLKISLLWEQYAGAQAGQQTLIALRALQTAEQARARALSDYQAIDISAPGIDPSVLTRRNAVYRELAARRSALEESLDRHGTADDHSQAIRSEIAGLRQELDQIDARIGAASVTLLTRPSPTSKVSQLQLGSIPPDVALIEYWLGARDAYAWVVTRDSVNLVSVGETDQINTRAIALHTALRSFGSVARSERLGAGEQLYALILKPVAAQLAGKHTLIFAPDGALHYVPFATLRYSHGGQKSFLVETYDVAVTPALQLFLRSDTSRSVATTSKRMLLVDDPVYDRTDPRVAHSSVSRAESLLASTAAPPLSLVRGPPGGGPLPRLPGAAKEAAAIAALLPADRVDRLESFAANRERFLTSSLDQYQLIHVASHATTDSEVPQASALILSTVDASGNAIDGRVLGADFMTVRLHADTVVLSACDTALGKSVAGEGLIGLQYAVLARGARSVVSSLWPAIDQTTAALMVNFYSSLLQPHSSVIAAWSAASRAALRGPYPDPGTWGAFMLTLSHIEDLNPT